MKVVVQRSKYSKVEVDRKLVNEIDSGLDIDALQVVSKGINAMRGDEFGSIIITHYQRLLNFVTPDYVHIVMDGHIVKSGDASLAKRLEKEGYKGLIQELELDVEINE